MKRKLTRVSVDSNGNLLDETDERRELMRRLKENWRTEGRQLGNSASSSAWQIGRWLCRGAALFLGEPSQTNKKQRNLWYRQYRDNWNAFIVEAADVTCLSESALRQYARVVRHGVRVEDLTFSHHIEVQRAHFYDEKGKRRFDSNRATEILELAKKNKWTVAQTRDEVRRRYPTSAVVESAVDKARRMLMEIVSSVSEQDYVTVVDALFTALQEVKERPKYQRGGTMLTLEEECAELF